jgi:hypothetical protein
MAAYPNESTIYAEFSQGSTQSRQDMKDILDGMVGLLIDFGDSYSKMIKTLNSPNFHALKVQSRLGDKLHTWNNEIKNLNLHQRRNLNRVITDIKYIVGSLQNSEKLYEELEQNAKSLREHWDSTRATINPLKTRKQLEDISKILALPYVSSDQAYSPTLSPAKITQNGQSFIPPTQTINQAQPIFPPHQPTPTTTYVQPGTTIYPQQVVQPASAPTRPSATTPPRPSNYQPAPPKYYVIDPVTGQRIEKQFPEQRGSLVRSISPTPGNVAPPSEGYTFRPVEPTYVLPPHQQPIQSIPRQSQSQQYQQYSPPPQRPSTPSRTSNMMQPPSRQVSIQQSPPDIYVADKGVQVNAMPQQPQYPVQQPPPTPPPRQATPPSSNPRDRSPPPLPIIQEVYQRPDDQPSKENDYQSRKQGEDVQKPFDNTLTPYLDAFEVFKETRLEADDQPTKIEVSQDGNRIFYGGETFGMLEFDHDGGLIPHGRIFSNRISDITPIIRPKDPQNTVSNPFITSRFKNSISGDVLIGEFNSWNVHLYDKDLQELGRLNSKSGPANRLPSTYPYFKATSAKPNTCLWYSGTQNISVVDTNNYMNNEINNFWTMRGKQVDPLGAHISKKNDIIGIGKYDMVGNSLHYYTPQNANTVLAYDRNDVFPITQNWLCIDGSEQGDVFFIGGSSSQQQRDSTAYILAITFDEEMDIIKYREFPPSSGHNAFQVLKVYPGNLIVSSTHCSIIMFLWNEQNFSMVRRINTQGCIFDLVLSLYNDHLKGPVVYSVEVDGSCKAYNFAKASNGGRQITLKPARRNEKVYEMGEYMSSPNRMDSNINYATFDPRTVEKLSAAERKRLRKVPAKSGGEYKEFGVRQIVIPDVILGKVQVEEREQHIYTGRRNLRLLECKNNQFILQTKPNEVKAFSDLYLLKRTGELIVLETGTSDLVKYDPNLKELRRLQGVRPVDNAFVSTVFSGCENKFLWAKGDHQLTIVDVSTFNYDAIPTFFGKSGESASAVTALAARDYGRLLGVYSLGLNHHITVVDLKVGLVRKSAMEVNSKFPRIYTCENSFSDNKIAFLAGSTDEDLNRGHAIIQAVTFDLELQLIDDLELKSSARPQGHRAVTALARAQDRDVMFAGVANGVFVIEWTGTHLCVLNYVDDIHSSLPLSLSVYTPTVIFTSSNADNHLNRIEFRPA